MYPYFNIREEGVVEDVWDKRMLNIETASGSRKAMGFCL